MIINRIKHIENINTFQTKFFFYNLFSISAYARRVFFFFNFDDSKRELKRKI